MAGADRSKADVSVQSWWHNKSTAELCLAAVAMTLGVFGVSALLDWRVATKGMNAWEMIAVDFFVALIPGLLVLKVMLDARARSRALQARLEMIADLNHHIRNGLDAIQLSAYSTRNAEAITTINSAVTRIDRALRELLSPGTAAQKDGQ